MFDGQQRAVRRNLIAQAALVWGQVGDLDEFIETGRIDAPRRESQPPPMTPEVERYSRAIQIAGRFVMPDEVDAWLASEKAPDSPTAPPVA